MLLQALNFSFFFFSKIQILGLFFLAIETGLLVRQSARLLKVSQVFFWTYVFLLAGKIVFLYSLQFYTWSLYPHSRYFLPPHQPLNYFFNYSWQHFGKEPLFALGVGLFFFLLLWLLTKISRGRFFHEEEKYLGGLAVIANMWPQNFLVVFLAFGLGIGVWLGRILRQRLAGQNMGLPFLNLRFFWPVSGVLLIILGQLLVKATFLENIRL